MKYGFVKVAAAIPLVKVADCQFNAQQTSKLIVEADSKGVQVIIFPELNLTDIRVAICSGRLYCLSRQK